MPFDNISASLWYLTLKKNVEMIPALSKLLQNNAKKLN